MYNSVNHWFNPIQFLVSRQKISLTNCSKRYALHLNTQHFCMRFNFYFIWFDSFLFQLILIVFFFFPVRLFTHSSVRPSIRLFVCVSVFFFYSSRFYCNLLFVGLVLRISLSLTFFPSRLPWWDIDSVFLWYICPIFLFSRFDSAMKPVMSRFQKCWRIQIDPFILFF